MTTKKTPIMNNKIIKIDDVEGKVYELDNWKPEQATQVKKHFTEKFKELKKAYDDLIEEFNWNKIIFESEMLFTPVMGKTYYLFQKNDGKNFMTLISPDEWGKNDFKYIGAFKQDSRQKWNHIKLEDK
tara:strand:+ start:905 stop:1288 length:384 start_codon:yes stop_codon:yes gene_type:complete